MNRLSIIEKLAEGAAVDLFLGRDPQGSLRVVEALRPEVASRMEVVQRISTEVKLRQTLSHPHLARRVDSHGNSTTGRFWTSEPVKGDTLRKLLKVHRRLGPLQAMSLTLSLAEAMTYLHARGLPHGSLTPGYILVETSGQRIIPKLLDSGLSLCRIPEAPVPGGRLLVAPEYLSPERVQGQRSDEQSDVYGLGVLLFELVTGHAPYSDPDVNTTRQLHVRGSIPRLPAGLELLEPIIHGCLAKSAANRLDMTALHSALTRAIATAQSRARRTPATSTALGTVSAPGKQKAFGSYQPVRLLGEGAMGQVYLARNSRTEREMAIKVLRGEHVQNQEIVARFFQEARAANKVIHERISQIYDCVDERVSGEGERCYLVMEYLTGSTLREAMSKTPMPLTRLLHLIQQVCEGLSAAHGAGVVHRDIKPENIFLCSAFGKHDQVKLVDFGIAKLSWDGGTQGKALTQNGELLGTPSYMAPEQLNSSNVDARADIYAVGTVLYELIGGRKPFKAKTLGELLVSITTTPPSYLGDVTAAGEPLPLALRRVVMRCLEKDPAKRPQSMAELGRMLADCGKLDPSDAAQSPQGVFEGEAGEPLELTGRFEPVRPEAAPSRKASPPPLPMQTRASTSVVSAPAKDGAILAHYGSRKQALAASRARGAELSLAVPSLDLTPGQSVKLRVSFADSGRTFDVTGSVAREPSDFGMRVLFTGTEKQRAAEMLAFCADRTPLMGTSQSRRLPVRIPCKLKSDLSNLSGNVSDLSRTGAFLVLHGRAPLVGSWVKLCLDPGPLGMGGSSVDVRIVWRGEKQGVPGVGVAFQNISGAPAELIGRYLQKRG
jgi:serine/threonine protein kinase